LSDQSRRRPITRRILAAIAITFTIVTAAVPQQALHFKAHLVGGDLAGNPIATRATGQADLDVIDGVRPSASG